MSTDLLNTLNAKTVAVTASGLGAASITAVPTHKFGEYLATEGFWLLSWAEWGQVLAALWIICLLVKQAIWPVLKFSYRIGRKLRGRG